MAYPSVTYSFTNGTTISATEVNQNFTDLINGLSDGTKDLNISALTAAGTTNLNGAVNLGNATSDDVTVTGYVAATVNPKTANSFDLGGSSQTWRSGYFATSVLTPLIKAIDGNGIKFQENGGTEVFSVSDAGAVTAGPSATAAGGLRHIAYGGLSINASLGLSSYFEVNSGANYGLIAAFRSLTGSNPYLSITTAANKITLDANGSSASAMEFKSGGVAVGDYSTAGAWTLGPGDFTGVHTLNCDYLRINKEGSTAGSTIIYDASGNLRWRVGAETNGSTPSYLVYNASSAGVYLGYGGTSWSSTSDLRMKKNIIDCHLGLSEVLRLRAVKFDYLTDSGDESARVGFIAQEVDSVLPHAVHKPEDKDKMMGVSATEMIPVLVKAIQELSAKVDTLQAEQAKLTLELAAVKAQASPQEGR